MEENIKTEKNQEVQEDKKGFRIGDLFQGLHVKDIFLGPTLPAFISPNVLKILVDNYNISPISTPEEDLKKILG